LRYDTKTLKENLKKIAVKPIFLDSVDSTNSYAKEMLKKEIKGEFLVLAEEQTGGRGRLQRNWYSPKGKGIWMSLVKENFLSNSEFGLISIISSLSVFNSLFKLYKIRAKLKWPNDVLYENKKLCGILTEGFKNNNKITHFIIGIGMNIYQDKYDYPEDLKNAAVSLIEILPQKIKREQIITSIVNEINAYFDFLKDGKIDLIIYKWKKNCYNLGRKISVRTGRKNIIGKFRDIDNTGKMVIETFDNNILTVNSGEVVQIEQTES